MHTPTEGRRGGVLVPVVLLRGSFLLRLRLHREGVFGHRGRPEFVLS